MCGGICKGMSTCPVMNGSAVEGPERLDRDRRDTEHGTVLAPRHAFVGISRSRIVHQIYTCRWAPKMTRASAWVLLATEILVDP